MTLNIIDVHIVNNEGRQLSVIDYIFCEAFSLRWLMCMHQQPPRAPCLGQPNRSNCKIHTQKRHRQDICVKLFTRSKSISKSEGFYQR